MSTMAAIHIWRGVVHVRFACGGSSKSLRFADGFLCSIILLTMAASRPGGYSELGFYHACYTVLKSLTAQSLEREELMLSY